MVRTPRIVYQDENAAIIDDFLSLEDFKFLWSYVQNEEMSFVHSSKWTKAFRLTDGHPLRGPVYLSRPRDQDSVSVTYPSGKAIDIIIKAICSLKEDFKPWIGKQGEDWTHFFARPYLYPVGSSLSWHRDNQKGVSGAFSYYCHPEWNVQWGGELLIADAKTKELEFPKQKLYGGKEEYIGSQLNNSFENTALLELGIGHYILPKPNRFILLTKGILHALKKVEAAAGNHVRASIQGFFFQNDMLDK